MEAQQRAGTTQRVSMPVVTDPAALEAQRARTDVAIERAMNAPAEGGAALLKASKALQAPINRYRKAAEQTQAATDEIVQTQVAPTLAEYGKLDSEYQNAVQARVKYRAQVMSQIDDMDRLSKSIAAEQPHDIWADASTPLKIGAIAAMSLGAAAQAFYGDRTNPVVDQIDNFIKRDLMMQRMRVEKNKADYANKNLLVNKLSAEGQHIQMAEDRAYVTAIDGVKGRLEAAKQLLTSPQMRSNIDRTIAELDMKAAQTKMTLQQNIIGQDIRMQEGVAELETRREAAAGRGGSVSAQVGLMREQRLAGKEAREVGEMDIPGWERVGGAGNYSGTSKKEAQELRATEATVTNATRSMDDLIGQLEKGAVTNLLSLEGYQQAKALANRVVVKVKGKGLVNAGANFTKLEDDLVKSGYLGNNGEVLRAFDSGAINRIRAAQADMWDDVQAAMKERGYKAAPNHPVFGGGNGE
ncbi:MAG TPA: hypothetical protein VFH51_11530 [Myxococcota bacterium]|nr:hypothetical protein [Myxococcota bacterium]